MIRDLFGLAARNAGAILLSVPGTIGVHRATATQPGAWVAVLCVSAGLGVYLLTQAINNHNPIR